MNAAAWMFAALLANPGSAPFAPMDFLAGRCFTAALPDGQARDTHCFAWLYEGHVLRDTHAVCVDGTRVYAGETTYSLEPGTRRLRWRYLSVLGLTIDGHLAQDGDTLRFSGEYLSGETLRDIRATWTRVGDGYRALTEERSGEDPWKVQSDLTFAADTRSSPRCED